MSVRSISLRKLIKILFSPANRRVSEIRKDIREDMNRSQDAAAGGGDFLRVLLFRNVSGLRLTGSDGWRRTVEAYTGEIGLARGVVLIFCPEVRASLGDVAPVTVIL